MNTDTLSRITPEKRLKDGHRPAGTGALPYSSVSCCHGPEAIGGARCVIRGRRPGLTLIPLLHLLRETRIRREEHLTMQVTAMQSSAHPYGGVAGVAKWAA
jgi:hypothetical protein